MGLGAVEQIVEELAAEVQAWVAQIQEAVAKIPSQADATVTAARATLQAAVQTAVGGFLKLFHQLEAEVQNLADAAPVLVRNAEKTLLIPAKEAASLAVESSFKVAVGFADAFADAF